MTNSHNSVNTDVDSPNINIMLAGTIASGKTTLLGALSVYEDSKSGVSVHPSGAGKIFKASNGFCTYANNCFNVGSESREIGEDPWPGATDPGKIPKEFKLQIDSPKIKPRISFSDFAGETFLEALHLANEQEIEVLLRQLSEGETEIDKIGKVFREPIRAFVEQIRDADIVLIVVSAKDVIDFPDLLTWEKMSALRMQTAYSLMAKKSNGLANKNVKILFVVTQCDQYKALLNNDKASFELGLRNLTWGAKVEPEQIIYTSSAYQTEIKKIGEAESLKFCPVHTSRRQSGQPLMLGINTLVEKICQVAQKVAAKHRQEEEERKRKEEEAEEKEKREMKGKIKCFVEDAQSAIDKARRILAKLRNGDMEPLKYLRKEVPLLEERLKLFVNYGELDDISRLRELSQALEDNRNYTIYKSPLGGIKQSMDCICREYRLNVD